MNDKMGARESFSNAIANVKSVFSSPSVTDEANVGDNGIMKAFIPNFLYHPPYGYPRYIDIPNMRTLATSPYVFMVTSTIIDEVCSVPWDIVPKARNEPDEDMNMEEDDELTVNKNNITLSHIKQAKEFFYNPNGNDESYEFIQRQFLRDILELDSGVIVKVFNRGGKMTQMFARDGGTFLKNPDIYGYLGNKADIIFPPQMADNDKAKQYFDSVLSHEAAYFQYGWTAGGMPVPFGKREIVWLSRNPRSDSIYGRAPIEILHDVILSLIYGSTYNLDMYINANMPEGIISLLGANQEQIKQFRARFEKRILKKDNFGNMRKMFHKYPITNQEAKFTPLQITSRDMEILQQQEWFSKLVWACFGVTPSELGYTENSNRATEMVQSKVFQRKAVKPLLSLIAYHINTQIIPEFGFDDIEFKFLSFDVQEELEKTKLYDMQIKAGIKSINEIRDEMGLEPVENGDDHKTAGSNPFGNLGGGFGSDEESSMRERFSTEEKALTTASPLTLKKKETIGSSIKKKLKEQELFLLDTIAKSFVTSKLNEIKSTTERKALSEDIINKIKDMLNLTNMKGEMEDFVRVVFMRGIERSEGELGMNFFPDNRKIDFLVNYNLDLVKNMSDELKNQLKAAIQRAYMNNLSQTQIKDEVKNLFDKASERVDAIIRTETTRIDNIGHLEGARQSGLKLKKKIMTVHDERTTDLCKRMYNKYKSNPIELNAKFKDDVTGQEWETPPFHVNCRSDIDTVQVEE